MRLNMVVKKWFAGAAILIFLIITSVIFLLFRSPISESDLQNIVAPEASLIYSSDAKVIGKVLHQNRTIIPRHEIPKHTIDALIATEDARYFEHSGVDYIAMFRVFFKSILLGNKSSGGGSTLSQQLAKNVFGREETSGFITLALAKWKEMRVSLALERNYSKEEILLLYLNTVPFGENCYGIESAAQRFFNKKTKNLNLEEAATLIGMLKANTQYNPRLYPDAALQRRNLVLQLMAQNQFISDSVAAASKLIPLQLDYVPSNQFSPYGYFNVTVVQQTISIVEDYNFRNNTSLSLERDGLRVYTTLNKKWQDEAMEATKLHIQKLQKKQDTRWPRLKKQVAVKQLVSREQQKIDANVEKSPLLPPYLQDSSLVQYQHEIEQYLNLIHAAMIAIENNTGKVRTYIGGNDHAYFPYDLVQSKHQAASAFKPFIYAALFQKGYRADDWLQNTAKSYKDYEGWTPANYDNSEGGFYSAAGALALSKNIPTIDAWFLSGYDQIDALHQKFFDQKKLNKLPATALGTDSYSLLELTSAYSVFGNNGHKAPLVYIDSIVTSSGEVIFRQQAQPATEVLARSIAAEINYCLNQTIRSGTARGFLAHNSANQWAGKTGTSQSNADAWFFAYSNDMTIGAWVGTRYPAVTMDAGLGTGSAAALPIVAQLAAKLPKSTPLYQTHYAQQVEFYKDENLMDKLKLWVRGRDTDEEKERKRAERKSRREKSFFKNLFKKKNE